MALPPFEERVERARAALPASLPPAGPELMVALDIDGTLLLHDGTAYEPIRRAVQELQRRGTHVVLATGRSTFATLPVAQQLGLGPAPVVCSNGAMVGRLEPDVPGEGDQGGADEYDVEPGDGISGDSSARRMWRPVRLHETGELGAPWAGPEWEGRRLRLAVTDRFTFDAQDALRTLRRELPKAMYAVEADSGFKVNRPFPPGELTGDAREVPFEELWSEPVSRLTLREPSLDAVHFHELMERVGLHGVGYAVGWTAWLDISPEGITKASSLEMLRRRLGVAPQATVAMGDGFNDVEMLRWAGYGVAMGQASEAVVDAADARTDPVAECGAGVILSALLPG